MMSHLNATRRTWTHALFVIVGVLALTGAVNATDKANSHYTWSAELVEFDEPAKMITVKSLVVGQEMTDWSDFNTGDRVMLTWSGITSASGVRYISHEESGLENARLTMPVEFVSVEKDGRYVTYRVTIPEGDWSSIASLDPGQWVTATAPFEASFGDTVVATIRPYNDRG